MYSFFQSVRQSGTQTLRQSDTLSVLLVTSYTLSGRVWEHAENVFVAAVAVAAAAAAAAEWLPDTVLAQCDKVRYLVEENFGQDGWVHRLVEVLGFVSSGVHHSYIWYGWR